MSKRIKSSFVGRHKIALSGLGAVAIISLSSLMFGFWSYSGPGGYAIRVVQAGRQELKLTDTWNSGWDDITAYFIKDYVAAHYYGDKATNVGTDSPYAFKRTYQDRGKTYTQSLSENINLAYAQKDANFDPITCSTQPPTAVRYIRGTVGGPGQASTIAVFNYAGQAESNFVLYDLSLNQTKSNHGEWKVVGINCLSLSLHPTRPYVTGLEALQAENLNKIPAAQRSQIRAETPYDQRNDRTF